MLEARVWPEKNVHRNALAPVNTPSHNLNLLNRKKSRALHLGLNFCHVVDLFPMEALFRRYHNNDGQVMFEATTIASTSSMDYFELRSDLAKSPSMAPSSTDLHLNTSALN